MSGDRGKKRKAEEPEVPDAPPPSLTRAKTMQETAKAAKDYLKRVGHEVHSPLAKSGNRPETRSRHKVRSAVEEMLAPEDKKRPELSVDEVQRYRNQMNMVFRLIDTDGDGVLSEEQLLYAMRSLGKRPRHEKIKKIMEELDKDKTGKITRKVFVEYMLEKRNSPDEDEKPAKPEPKAAEPAADKAEEEPAAAGPSSADKGKGKADEAPANPAMALLNRGSSILDFYTENAGMHEIPIEGFEGPDRDLGRNNAFNSFSILLMNFNKEAALKSLFDMASKALSQKGFSVVQIDTEEELIDYANSFDEIWIASSDQPTQNPEKILEVLRQVHRAGKGIGIWAGGDPYYEQANLILKDLVSTELEGSYACNGSMKLVGLGDDAKNANTLARSLLTTGLSEVQQGAVYSRLVDLKNGTVMARNKLNQPAMVSWEGSSRSGYVFLNCSLVPLLQNAEHLEAERRLLSNIGVWLLGLEDRMKLGLRLVGDIQASTKVAWEYFLERPQDGKKAGWHPYEEQANKIVEAAYQKYLNSDQALNNVRAFITVHSGTFTYEVDFKTMTQRNIAHENHKVRKIRRVGDEE